MRSEKDLHGYQLQAIDHVLKNKGAGLFIPMGMGKTIISLSAINSLMYDSFEIKKVLIIAPLRVCYSTWQSEAKNWSHLRHLTFSEILGDAPTRIAALKAKADIYITNRDNVAWISGFLGSSWPFDLICIDELSSFKNHAAIRFKALKKVRPLSKRVIGLTGTPSPNGLIDLFSQLYLLDMGDRLCKNITTYREKYFRRKFSGFGYEILEGSEGKIRDKIKDICISFRAEDYLCVPERIDLPIKIALNRTERQQYDTFERDLILGIKDTEITALNAAVLMGKLLQYCNGAVFDEDKNIHEVHSAKLEALLEIVEAANEPILVFYRYKHDLIRINKLLSAYKPRELKTAKDQDDWNDGKIQVLLAQPQSASHGLNLQHGGSLMVWFGEPWSSEIYAQACARLHRQGQLNPVRIYSLIIENSVDEDVVKALRSKLDTQEALLESIKAKILKYTK